MMIALEAAARLTSDSLMAPTPPWITLYYYFLVRKLYKTLFYCFHRSLYICLYDDRQVPLQFTCLDLVKQIIQRQSCLRIFQQTLFLLSEIKVSAKLLGLFFILNSDNSTSPAFGTSFKTQDLHRCGWAGFFYPASLVIHHCTNLTTSRHLPQWSLPHEEYPSVQER